MRFIPNLFDHTPLTSLIHTSGGIWSEGTITSPSPSKAAQVRHKGVNPFTRFLVSDIGRESLILGYPWLAAFEPHFKWKEGTLDPQYLPIMCHSILPVQQLEDQQERRAIVAQLEDECTNWSIATKLAIQAKSEPLEVKLPEVCTRYVSVFSEEEALRFPPSRPWDHAIDFKSGAPDAIDCKVYPITRTEDDALDKFIDKQLTKGYIHPSIFPYASSFFFIKKKDRLL